MGISLGNLINVNYQHLKRSVELVVMLNGIGLLYSSIKALTNILSFMRFGLYSVYVCSVFLPSGVIKCS